MISASLKLERCPVHLRPGQGGLRLPTAKFREPVPRTHRPRPSRHRPPTSSSSRPTSAEDSSEPRTEGGRASAEVAPSPARREAGPAPRAAPCQRQPRRMRPLVSRPPRPGSRARIGPTFRRASPAVRKAGVSRGAAGRSLPPHYSGLDLDLPHARIGHGP